MADPRLRSGRSEWVAENDVRISEMLNDDPRQSASDPQTAPQRAGTALLEALIPASYLVWAVFFTWPLALNLGRAIPMPRYIQDTPWVHNLWTSLWWLNELSTSITGGGPLPIQVDSIFYPLGMDALAYVIQCLVPALAFIPLQAALPMVAAANLPLLLILTLAAGGCYLLVCRLTGDRFAAYLAGLAFAFCCPQLANAQGHLLVVASIPLIPLVLLGLIETCRSDRVSARVLLAAALVGLFFSYWYYFLFTALMGLIVLILRPPDRNGWVRLLQTAVLPVLVIVPVSVLVLRHSGGHFAEPLTVAAGWSVDLLAFVLPTQDHSLLGGWGEELRAGFGANPTIQSATLGLVPLLLAGAAFRRRNRRDLLPWLTGFILFSLLALGPVLHVGGRDQFGWFGRTVSIPLPFVWFHWLPVFDAIRDCSMFLVMSTLALAVLAGYGAASVIECARRKRLVFGLLLAALAAEQLMLPYPLKPVGETEVYRSIGHRRISGTTLEIPLRNDIRTYEFHQIFHRQRRLAGNLSRMDAVYASYGDEQPLLGLFKDPARLVAVEAAGTAPNPTEIAWLINFFDLHTVIVENQYLSAAEQGAVTAWIERSLPVRDRFQSEDRGVSVFELETPANAAPEPLVIDFGAPPPYRYVQKGWYGPERWGPESAPELSMRWSEGRESELILWLDGNRAYRGELIVQPLRFPGAGPQRLELFINDHPVADWRLTEPAWIPLTFSVPAAAVRPGLNRLRFRYGTVARPADVIPGNDDPRQLAVAFDRITLRAEQPAGGSGPEPNP